MKRTHDQALVSQSCPGSPVTTPHSPCLGASMVSLRHSARLAHFARLIEEEREKKQRLEWYLQEVLLEREALTTESFGYAASVLPTLNRHLNDFKPANKAFFSTTTPAVPTVAPPTTTTSPTMGERCGSCGQLSFGLGACRCHSFESVRKRQRRLSLFVRTGTLGVDESGTGGGDLSSSFGSAVEQARPPLVAVLDDDDTNNVISSTTSRVTINQSMVQAQRQGDDSEDEREEELAQESENSEGDEEDEAELVNDNRTKGTTSSIRRGDTKHLREAATQRRLSVSHFFCSDAPLFSIPSSSGHLVARV